MPITSDEHLKHDLNRSRLVIIADTGQLTENDCEETLTYYGAIKNLQLTPERNAAFVDFECEHAPLLVKRCFEYYKTPFCDRLYAENEKRRKSPMPKGASTILPGCSLNNYIYLQHVPRAVKTKDLYNHFFPFSSRNRIQIYRPGPDDNPSTRVVVRIKGTPAERYHRQQFVCKEVKSGYKTYTFYAIPQLDVLTNARDLFEKGGCEKCNTAEFALMPDYVALMTKRAARPTPDREIRPVVIHFPSSVVAAPELKTPKGSARSSSFPCEERWDDVPIPPPPVPWRPAVREKREEFFGSQESSNPFFSCSAVSTTTTFSRREERSNVVTTRASQESAGEAARENRADEKRKETRQAIDNLPGSRDGKESEEQRVAALPTPSDCSDAAMSEREERRSEVEQGESARALSEDGGEEKRDETDLLEEEKKEQRSDASHSSSPPARALSADSLATAIEKEAGDAAANDDPAVLMMTRKEEKGDEEMGEEGEGEGEETIDPLPSPTLSLAASDTVSPGASPTVSLEGTLSPTPSPPLHHEDTESCREETDPESDEEEEEDELTTARGYGSPSEESTLSEADTVVGDGFYEDPELWDEVDRIAYGHKRAEAMEMIQEEETPPTSSSGVVPSVSSPIPTVSTDLPPLLPILEEETREEEEECDSQVRSETEKEEVIVEIQAIEEMEETREEPVAPAPAPTVSIDVQPVLPVENKERSDAVPERVPSETAREETRKDYGSQVPLKPKRKQEPVSKLDWRNWHDPQLRPAAVPQFLPRRPLPSPPSYFSRGSRPSPAPVIVVPAVVKPIVSSPKPTVSWPKPTVSSPKPTVFSPRPKVSWPRPSVSATANPLSLSYHSERWNDVPKPSPPKPQKSAENGSQDNVTPQSPLIQLKTSEKEIVESGSQGAVPAQREKEKAEAVRENQDGTREKKGGDTVSSPAIVPPSCSRQEPLVPRRRTSEGDEIGLEPIEEVEEIEHEKKEAEVAKAVSGREERESSPSSFPVMVAEASALVFPSFGRRVEVEQRTAVVPVEKGVSFGCFRRNEEANQRGPIHPGTTAVIRVEEKTTVDQDEGKTVGGGVVPQEKGVSFGCFRKNEEGNQQDPIHPGTTAVIRVGEKTTVDQVEVKATGDGVFPEEKDE